MSVSRFLYITNDFPEASVPVIAPRHGLGHVYLRRARGRLRTLRSHSSPPRAGRHSRPPDMPRREVAVPVLSLCDEASGRPRAGSSSALLVFSPRKMQCKPERENELRHRARAECFELRCYVSCCEERSALSKSTSTYPSPSDHTSSLPPRAEERRLGSDTRPATP